MEKKLEELKKEYNSLTERLGDPGLISDFEKFEELSRRKKSLEKIVDKIDELENFKKQIEENKAILKAQEDQDLSSLAETEILQLQEAQKNTEKELNDIIKKNEKGDDEPKPAIIEIRAGTGGDEAALFAGDLFKMYSRYAAKKNWKQKVLDSSQNEIGGIKEIIFEFSGGNVFNEMKFEGGVHRVQRIPKTEKSGRVHTSTATVAVLAKPKSADFKIRPDELRVDYFCSSGPGGQYVNKTESAVRITHLPTGIAVASQTERSQLQNKENAMAILIAKLLEKKEREEQEREGGNRNSQIGGAKRAEKIRTYNFPQDRLTDHRLKKNWHGLEKIMDGEIENIISAFKEIE
jgi:peptide chain release factor 1